MPTRHDDVMSPAFNLNRFLDDVFAPREVDVFLVLTDRPREAGQDNDAWVDRRAMAAEWRDELVEMSQSRSFEVLPLLTIAAVENNSADLPEFGQANGEQIALSEVFHRATVVIAMTEVSVTGPLMQIARTKGAADRYRVASMPLANRSMERTAWLAETNRLVERGDILLDALNGCEAAEVTFTTGDVCLFDLRYRQAGADNGYLHADKEGEAFINLPSGEVWIVPYEGERPDEKSRTGGVIPVVGPDGEIARFVVEENRITEVTGDGPHASALREELAVDPARRNIGEMAFGYNDAARVVGLFIEDEKAGFHFGYGRSEFLGGVVGPDSFKGPWTVQHIDLPYAKECPITVSVDLIKKDETRIPVLREGDYVLW